MANNRIQVKRTAVAGRQPNTTSSSNTQYINQGELALNTADKILYTSDGTNLIYVGANQVNQSVSNLITVGNSTVNVTVNSTIFSGTSNNSTYFGGLSLLTVEGYIAGNSATAYSNAISTIYANSGTFTGNNTFSGIVYVNSTLYANGSAGLSGQVLTTNGSTGAPYWSTVSGVNTSAQYTWSNTQTFNSNIVISTTSGISANGTYGITGQALLTNGSAVYWGNVVTSGGSGTGTLSKQEFVANGAQNTFTFAGGYRSNTLAVYLNGVLSSASEVTATDGYTFTFASAPPSGAIIDAVGVSGLASNAVSLMVSQQFTADGVSNTFTITGGYVPNQILVFLNGVKQNPANSVNTSSGTTVNFYSTPPNNAVIDVYGYQTAAVITSNVVIVGNTTIGTNNISVGSTFSVNSTQASINSVSLSLNGVVANSGQVLLGNSSAVYWSNTSAQGANNDQVFLLNGTTVTANYAIPTGYNAVSGGPITINSNVNVTIPTGSYWTVV